jgi:hypothetical protein
MGQAKPPEEDPDKREAKTEAEIDSLAFDQMEQDLQ